MGLIVEHVKVLCFFFKSSVFGRIFSFIESSLNFFGMCLVLLFSAMSMAQTLSYEGTLFDSSEQVIAESGVKLKAEIFDDALVCVLYEREYLLDLSNSAGHFRLDLSAGTAPSAQPHSANTLTQILSNAAGNNVTCANSVVRSFTGVFVKRQIRVSVLAVSTVDIADIQLPAQDLEMVAFAGEAETSKKFTGAITGDVSGTSSTTKVTKIQGVDVDATSPTDGQVLKYDNGTGKYVPSAIDSSVITDNSVSVNDVDFASASGINIPTLTAAPGGPSKGQIYFNSVDSKVYFYNGSGWIDTGAGGGDFLANGSVALSGNLKLNGNYLSGDGDNEGVFVAASGNVGVGTATPGEKLDVAGKVKGTELCIGADCRSSWPLTSSGGTVTQVDAGTGLTGGTITATGTIGLASTAVTAGSYGSATQVPIFTVDAQGRLTAAANITVTDNDTTYAAATTSVAGLMSGADKTKLNGVEASATADQTATEILTAVKTVDGLSSGLDADLLDGLSSVNFVQTESDPTVLASVKDGVSWSEVTGKPVIPDGNSLDASDGSPANALTVDAVGNVGLGTTTPSAKMDVNGEIRIGNAGLACTASSAGALRYNSTTKRMEFCNGSSWSQLSAGTVASVNIGNPNQSLTQSGPVEYVITYGSATDTSTINLNSGSISFFGTDFTDCTVTAVANTSTFVRTVTVNGCTGTGTVAISVNLATASSTTGDPAPSAGPAAIYSVDNTGPSIPSGLTLGSVPQSLASTPTVSYSASTDTGGSTVNGYEVKVTRVSDSTVIQNWAAHTSGVSVTGLSLSASTEYAIAVRAIDALGNTGNTSGTQTWTTISGFPFSPVLSSNTTNYDLHAEAVTAGWDQVIPLLATVTIDSGVIVYGADPSTPAFKTGTLTAGSSLTINNNGSILGGAVSSGASDKTTNQAWEGGIALELNGATTINNTGSIIGGAGGGGAGEGDSCGGCGGGNGATAGGQGGAAIVFNADATVTNSGSIYGAGGGGAGGGGAFAAGIGSGRGGNGQGSRNGSIEGAVSGQTSSICGGGFGGAGATYGQSGAGGGNCGNGAAGGGAGGYSMVLNGNSITFNASNVATNSSYSEGTWVVGTKGRVAP